LIRFLADGDDGRMLFMGLSESNLELLEGGEPIAFALEEYGIDGYFGMVYGGETALQIEREKVSDHPFALMSLTDSDYIALRGGDLLTRSFVELGLDASGAVTIFVGASELEILDQLRASGIVDPSTPIAGVEEYFAHEAGLVPGCEKCAAREPHEHLATPVIPAGRPMGRPGGSSNWRERLYAHPGLVALGVAAMCVVAGLVLDDYLKSQRAREAADNAPQGPSAETVAFIASDKARRTALDAYDPVVLNPALGAECPAANLLLPVSIGRRPIAHFGPRDAKLSDQARFKQSLERYLLFAKVPFDAMPAIKGGVGPVTKRVQRDGWIDRQVQEFAQPYQVTVVVQAWVDPEIPKRVTNSTNTYKTGGAATRLLLWDFRKSAFICASPIVMSSTEALTVVRQKGRHNALAGLGDDPLAKARVELLIRAARDGAEHLQAITPL